MPWDFDYEGDFLLADGIEEVSLVPQEADGGEGVKQDGRGFWESPDHRLIALAAAVDRVWHLFGDDFAEVQPGDCIRDKDGQCWVVSRAQLDGIGDQWRCETTKAVESSESGEQYAGA